MKLTGKCKEAFEDYCLKNNEDFDLILGAFSLVRGIMSTPFYKLPESVQYGVFVDFFDSKGIFIADWGFVDYVEGMRAGYDTTVTYLGKMHSDTVEEGFYLDRKSARKAAIEKASAIFNET